MLDSHPAERLEEDVIALYAACKIVSLRRVGEPHDFDFSRFANERVWGLLALAAKMVHPRQVVIEQRRGAPVQQGASRC